MRLILFFYALLPALAAQTGHRDLLRGDEHYLKNNFAKAETAYRAAGHPGAYNAGNAAYQQGKYPEAIALYKNVTGASLRADALYNMGNAYLVQGQYKDAITAYEAGLRLQPNRADAKKNLQIAQKKQREQNNPPPPQPPPPPPPPRLQPRLQYLDQARTQRQRELPFGPMPRETALRLLKSAVAPQEELNALQYRGGKSRAKPSGSKKNW